MWTLSASTLPLMPRRLERCSSEVRLPRNGSRPERPCRQPMTHSSPRSVTCEPSVSTLLSAGRWRSWRRWRHIGGSSLAWQCRSLDTDAHADLARRCGRRTRDWVARNRCRGARQRGGPSGWCHRIRRARERQATRSRSLNAAGDADRKCSRTRASVRHSLRRARHSDLGAIHVGACSEQQPNPGPFGAGPTDGSSTMTVSRQVRRAAVGAAFAGAMLAATAAPAMLNPRSRSNASSPARGWSAASASRRSFATCNPMDIGGARTDSPVAASFQAG